MTNIDVILNIDYLLRTPASALIRPAAKQGAAICRTAQQGDRPLITPVLQGQG